jgi:pyridoxal biosynthesis lyase PdxS
METATFRVKAGLAQMLKGGVIMDVVTAEHAKIAEDAGACLPISEKPAAWHGCPTPR